MKLKKKNDAHTLAHALALRSFVRSCVRTYVRLCVRTYVRSFVRSCVRTYVCSFVRSIVRSHVRTFVRIYVRTFVRFNDISRFFQQYCVALYDFDGENDGDLKLR